MPESLTPKSPEQPSCLLCQGTQLRIVECLSGTELRALWKALGHEFSPEAWGRIGPDFSVARRQCGRCGFTFFDPVLAGNEAFYRELEHGEYFASARPEFQRTLTFLRPLGLKRVLDVGCGSGIFLDQAKGAGMETYGLEFNAKAAEKARAKGHRISHCLLRDFQRSQVSGELDLITIFQVLEHVSDPLDLVRQAAGLLDAGKYIAVAVPSIQGPGRFIPWDPHQWPPHHLSWWRLEDFDQLAAAAGLKLVKRGGDMFLGGSFEQLWRMHNQLAAVLGRPGHRSPVGLVKLVSFLYRKTGMKFFFPRWGSSIYAYFQKE